MNRLYMRLHAATLLPASALTAQAEITLPPLLTDNPDCNLIDNSGLPVYPFRTDDFPMLSDSHEGY